VADQFQSLYRRYRPQRFSEVKGQDHVVLGLRNAVRDERVAHAYLFSGPRGTGKTSTARILAKALNCAKPEEGEPCGHCDSCLDIARGASLDVHELDAASNNGVDAMRDLVARASLATPGKWKVYIVDEVHMLSTAASNALLKTLEEPPGHVVFVLATTDPQKVLPTIRSRTQHFEFHLLESSTLETLLTDIANDAHLDLPTDGIEAAVRRAHGSARDALSALDLVAAAGVVEDDSRWVRELISAISERDTKLALQTVDAATTAGFDAARLAGELVDGLRDVFLGSVAPDLRRPPTATGAADDGGASARLLGPARCVRALEMIGAAIVDMREALDARTTFEVALVRLTHPEVDDSPAAMLERIERLERRLQEVSAGGASPAAASPPRAVAQSSRESTVAGSGPTPRPSASPGTSPALGAYLRQPREAQPGGAVAAPPSAAGVTDSSDVAGEPSPSPSASGAATAADPAPAPALLGTGAQPPSTPPGVIRQPPSTPSAAVVEEPAPAASTVPTRDDLVTAWADHVLPSLRPRARAVFAVGRFVTVSDGVAVFALPNSAHVEHASPLVDEVAEAISRQVGGRVGLRLVTEPEGSPPIGDEVTAPTRARSPRRQPTSGSAADPSASPANPRRDLVAPEMTGAGYTEQASSGDDEPELDDLVPGEAVGRNDSASWAEDRLREAFPGAEEVP
jgi:DNA polymerase-3 subunit gamma/tau